MRLRLFAAAAARRRCSSLAAASATGATHRRRRTRAGQRHSRVWLMGDAQSNWPEAVAAANQSFKAAAPRRRTSRSQYQTWGDYKTKFEATLAGRQRRPT